MAGKSEMYGGGEKAGIGAIPPGPQAKVESQADRRAVSLIDAVRDAVLSIPVGRVATYGDIGASVGVGARQAGRLVGMLDGAVPWWRVVRADGRPASCHAGTASGLLCADNTPMLGGRIDMARARFRPPRLLPPGTRAERPGHGIHGA